jgi:hypothetical protein
MKPLCFIPATISNTNTDICIQVAHIAYLSYYDSLNTMIVLNKDCDNTILVNGSLDAILREINRAIEMYPFNLLK